MHLQDLPTVLPELVLGCLAMALLMLGVFQGDRHTPRVMLLSVVALGVVLSILALAPRGSGTAFGGLFVVDRFSDFMKGLVLLASATAIVMSLRFFEQARSLRFEYPVLMLFATLGMLMMISADDLIALYLGLELQSLSLYVIAAFRRDSLRSTEAGLKYFVLGALSSGMLLYGASMIYGFAGTTGFADLARVLAEETHDGALPSTGIVVGLVFLLAGLAFKVAAVPFHMWTPDVYEGAPTPVTAFFASAPKVAAMALFVRVMTGPFADLSVQWTQIVVFISIASMVLGAFAAIVQTNIKRLMAYSSIGHVGYALVGLAVGSAEGIGGVLIYMTIYLFMNVGTFAVILSMRANGRLVEGINDLSGLSKTRPVMAAALAVMMFSMAGIPPFAGFFGKFFIFKAAVDAGLIPLAVVGVLTSVVAAFYYLRIVKIIYFDEAGDQFEPMTAQARLVLGVASVFVGAFFLFPLPQIVLAADTAAKALFGG